MHADKRTHMTHTCKKVYTHTYAARHGMRHLPGQGSHRPAAWVARYGSGRRAPCALCARLLVLLRPPTSTLCCMVRQRGQLAAALPARALGPLDIIHRRPTHGPPPSCMRRRPTAAAQALGINNLPARQPWRLPLCLPLGRRLGPRGALATGRAARRVQGRQRLATATPL